MKPELCVPALLQVMHVLCVVVQQCGMLSTLFFVVHVCIGLHAFMGFTGSCRPEGTG